MNNVTAEQILEVMVREQPERDVDEMRSIAEELAAKPEWTVNDMASIFAVHIRTVHGWLERGYIPSNAPQLYRTIEPAEGIAFQRREPGRPAESSDAE